ncbi:hypothetical protein [Ruminococcus sp. OA3]|nr:hypothetical protein [Ruminococcus sp. OA3]
MTAFKTMFEVYGADYETMYLSILDKLPGKYHGEMQEGGNNYAA